MESNSTPKKVQIGKDAQILTDIITKTWDNNRKKKVKINAKRKKKNRVGK